MPPQHIPHGIAKSGWLFRQSTFLHKWKMSYVVLYMDGRIAYFEDSESPKAEDVINIPRDRAIVVGPEYCVNVAPPDGKTSDLLFAVKTSDKNWHFCADDKDDLMAWKLAIQEAFHVNYVPQSPPSSQYTMYAPPGSAIVVTDRGPTIYDPQGRVIYVSEDARFRRNNSCDGFLAGAALGTLFLWPWWWPWWFFWC